MNLKINIERIREEAKLFIAAPMYGGQCTGIFAKSCNELAMFCTKYNIPVKFHYLFNESLITRARNYCADEFLRSDCTHMLFIDSDIGFNHLDPIVLLHLQLENADNMDVVCAPYPKKSISWEKIVKAVDMGMAKDDPFKLENFVGDYVFNPAPGTTEFKISEPVEVLESGTGFMLIPRKTFEQYEKAFPELNYLPDHIRTANFDGTRNIMAYFDCIFDRADSTKYFDTALKEIEANPSDTDAVLKVIADMRASLEAENNTRTNRYLSEDYMFCQKVREAGMQVWLCPWMELKHMGSYIFGGSIAALAAIQASPTADASSNEKFYKKDDVPAIPGELKDYISSQVNNPPKPKRVKRKSK